MTPEYVGTECEPRSAVADAGRVTERGRCPMPGYCHPSTRCVMWGRGRFNASVDATWQMPPLQVRLPRWGAVQVESS